MSSKTKTASMHVRVNPEVKKNAESVLDELGISTSELFNMLLCQVAIKRGVPFELYAEKERIPNAVTQAAFDECEAMVRGEIPMPPAMSTAEFIESMKGWIDDEV